MTGRSTGFGQTTLNGTVTKITDRAVLFDPDDPTLGDEFWVPRRVCLDGDNIDEGDSEIAVANWWLTQNDKL